MRRALLAPIAAALVLAVAAGCTDSTSPDLIQRIDAAPSAAPAASAAPQTCKPGESARPTGALPAPGRMPAGSTMARILKRGRLILGTSQDTLLFSSRNPFTGEVEGFDVDMARQIAAAIFGDPGKIEIKVIGYDKRVQYAADGTVDLVADTMTITCQRKGQVAFSTVYYNAGQQVLVSKTSKAKGLQDLGGRRVCAATGSTSLDNIAKAPAKPIAVGRPDFATCLVAFQQNEVDAISTDDTILAGLVTQDPYAKVVGPKFTAEPYGIATAKENVDFVKFMNQVLARDRADGTWKRTYQRWLGDFGPAPAPPRAEYTP
jgi:polar amino acid transport system substrate-binding protein